MSDFDDDEPNKGSARDDDDPQESRGQGREEDDWDDDDWDDDDRGGRRDMTLIIVIAVAVAVIALVVILTRPKNNDNNNSSSTTSAPGSVTSVTKDNFCEDWPAIIGGDGKNVSSGEGVYVWSDFGGWHVRSNRTDQVVVKMTGPAPIKVTNKANAQVSSSSAPSVTLTIPAGDGKTGPDLDLNCDVKTVDIEVSAGGTDVKPTDIKLGGSGKADSNPVTITRGTP